MRCPEQTVVHLKKVSIALPFRRARAKR